MFHKPSEDRRSEQVCRTDQQGPAEVFSPERREVAGCCQELLALASTQSDFFEVLIHQVQKSQPLQVQQVMPQDRPATRQRFDQSRV